MGQINNQYKVSQLLINLSSLERYTSVFDEIFIAFHSLCGFQVGKIGLVTGTCKLCL